MADKRPLTTNYNWPLLFPQGNQIYEISTLNDTLSDIDASLFGLSQTLSSFTVSFKDIRDTPTTLEGYGITDAYTDKETDAAIKKASDALKGSAPDDLSTLEALAKAIANDPKFSETVVAALSKRVAVDQAQSFKLAEKKQARDNIEAVGVVDKGAADGVAPLDANSKVPSANLPQLTTTATVGAAMAAANAIQTPADGDTFSGVKSGTSTMFKITWGNLKSAFTTIVNTVVSGNMSGRAYPRKSNGSSLDFIWSGQARNPGYVWGIDEPGTTAYPHPPANLNVGWANGANYADRLGNNGWTLATVQDQLNSRVTDTRFSGYIQNDMFTTGTRTTSLGGTSGYVMCDLTKNAVESCTRVYRQPQIYIPNVGWRALGGW